MTWDPVWLVLWTSQIIVQFSQVSIIPLFAKFPFANPLLAHSILRLHDFFYFPFVAQIWLLFSFLFPSVTKKKTFLQCCHFYYVWPFFLCHIITPILCLSSSARVWHFWLLDIPDGNIQINFCGCVIIYSDHATANKCSWSTLQLRIKLQIPVVSEATTKKLKILLFLYYFFAMYYLQLMWTVVVFTVIAVT